MKAFLVCAFIAAIALCVLALLFGTGTTGSLLYNLGAVLAIVTGGLALTGSWLTDLLKEDTK